MTFKTAASASGEKFTPAAMGMVLVTDDSILDGTSGVFEEDVHMWFPQNFTVVRIPALNQYNYRTG
jgi:hypothetical protein